MGAGAGSRALPLRRVVLVALVLMIFVWGLNQLNHRLFLAALEPEQRRLHTFSLELTPNPPNSERRSQDDPGSDVDDSWLKRCRDLTGAQRRLLWHLANDHDVAVSEGQWPQEEGDNQEEECKRLARRWLVVCGCR